MMVRQCDVCGSEDLSVTAVFVAVKGEWDQRQVDAQATIDLCRNCKRKFVGPIEANDTHVRATMEGKGGR